MSLLACDSLTKSFGGLVAVDGVSFSIEEGQIMSLIGPNGAGKSTVLNLIGGFIVPDQGSIRLDNERVDGRPPHAIARRGLRRTFQLESLFPELSVGENLALGAVRADTDGWNLADLSDLVGLAGRESEMAGLLPYGFKRRLAVGVALAGTPRLLLLDEPAAGLNFSESLDLVRLIQDVRARGVTVLLIEHDMDVVSRVADEVVVMDHGSVIASGDPHVVLNDRTVAEVYLGRWFKEDAS